MTSIRNILLCIGLGVVAYFSSMLVDFEPIIDFFSSSVSYSQAEVIAISISFAFGVCITSAILVLVVQSPYRWLWVLGYCGLWAALLAFPNMKVSHHYLNGQESANLITGAANLWPSTVVLFFGLLGARAAWVIKDVIRRNFFG